MIATSEQTIDPSDYEIEDGLSESEVVDRLRCPITRICNIYKIKDADGKEVRFRPNWAQCRVLYKVYIEGVKRIAIPKARQLGFSTLIAIISLDETYFSQNKQASIVDQTQLDASEKLEKVAFAYEKLPSKLREDKLIADSAREIAWSNGSKVNAGKNARGGTNQVLHISEWGPIAYDDPKRSREIKTGAIPSVSGSSGKIFAESTHKGGKGGDWYELIKRSLETPEEYRTDKDFEVMFFPWWQEPRYILAGNASQIDEETNAYLDAKEIEVGIKFSQGQRLFYYKIKQEQGRDVFAEYPTTIEECWLAPTPGAIYSPDVDKARLDGRISESVSWYEGFPVYTAFDIGAPENQKVWIFQVIGDQINYLESISGGDDCKMPAHWAARLKAKKYQYGGHFLPHDGEILWYPQLAEAGLKGVAVVPRQMNLWDGINDSLTSFSRCRFNSKGCADGVEALEAYHSKEENDGVTIRDIPVHDWASHYSDCFSISHQAIRRGMLVDRSAIPSKPRSRKPRALAGVGGSSSRRAIR